MTTIGKGGSDPFKSGLDIVGIILPGEKAALLDIIKSGKDFASGKKSGPMDFLSSATSAFGQLITKCWLTGPIVNPVLKMFKKTPIKDASIGQMELKKPKAAPKKMTPIQHSPIQQTPLQANPIQKASPIQQGNPVQQHSFA